MKLSMIGKLIVSGAALVAWAAVSSAMAADMPLKAPAVSAPTYDWTGFYIGAQGGIGSSFINDTVVVPFAGGAFPAGTSLARNNPVGAVVGGQGGFNWQFNNFVIGVEGDYLWTNMSGASTSLSTVLPTVTSVATSNLSDVALGTARLGYAWDNLLLYVKGGGAWGHTSSSSQSFAGAALISTTASSTNRTGWTVGTGIEFMMMQNVSARFEYDHIDFGTQAITVAGTSGAIAGTTSTLNSRDTVDMLTIGLNYKFSLGMR
jgi:outer membrane immunogenic protein